MPSLRCRLFLFLLQHRHLLRLKKKETVEDWFNGLDEVRRSAAKSSKMLGKLPKRMTSTPVDIKGMYAEWISPEGAARDEAILYFHGGGYVLGDVAMHRGITAKFARQSGVPALLFEYRLAPEHPHPAALDDALAAYRHLLDSGYAPERVVFMGDSAGGGLCLATLLAAKDQGLPMPSGAVALSPWADLECTGESYRVNAGRCLSPEDSWRACRAHYAQGQDLRSPYISPLYGDLSELPPLLLFAGGHEALRDDSVEFAKRAEAAGVEVTLTVGEKLCHCYPACAPIFPEATRALVEIGDFIRSRTGG